MHWMSLTKSKVVNDMNVNEYLRNNPKLVKGLFTKIFGKYMLRYYDKPNYTVYFDETAPTSFQDEKNERIVISLENIIMMLQKDVNVLAVAYHELAHTLYTKNSRRDKMRVQASNLVLAYAIPKEKLHETQVAVLRQKVQNHMHSIWNVLEDTRIERLLVQEYKFLKEIIEPLSNIIPDSDDLLFKWRKGQLTSGDIYDIAESFCKKRVSVTKRADYMFDIYMKLYYNDTIKAIKQQVPDNDYDANKQVDTKADELSGDNQDYEQRKQEAHEKRSKRVSYEDMKEYHERMQERVRDREIEIEDLEEAIEQREKTGVGQASLEHTLEQQMQRLQQDQAGLESLEENLQRMKDTFEQEYNEDIDKSIDTQQAYKQMQEIHKLQASTPQDLAVKSMLESVQQTIVENQEKQDYVNSVEEYDNSNLSYLYHKVDKVYSSKQQLRNGMSAAQAKRYSLNISNKVNVHRLVNAQANRVAPNVFYGRGKDINFTKKVVIFEDVSGSTQDFTHVFSSIAYGLANSFDSVEWWGYSDLLFKKKPEHYEYTTQRLGMAGKMHVGGTNASRLLSVMKKYRNKDYTYVIITDGDMRSIFKDIDLWNSFKDRVAVIGFLDKEIKSKAPHHVDVLEYFAKQKGYVPKPTDDIYDIMSGAQLHSSNLKNKAFYYPAITFAINGVMDLVKGRLR